MGKHRETDKGGARGGHPRSPSPAASSSSYSLSRNCRAQRRTTRRRITRLVHTFCFFRPNADGSADPFYYQLSAESAIRSPATLRAAALRQVDENRVRMAERALERFGGGKAVKLEEGAEESGERQFPGVSFVPLGQAYFLC